MRSIVGIFVGGGGRRLGGVAKGLLPSPQGGRIVERLAEAALAADLDVVLVGSHTAYEALGLPTLDDLAPGPLGGLRALLAAAHERPRALVVACDMPHVGVEDLVRLAGAYPEAVAVAARSPGRPDRWEPFYAAYDPARASPRIEALAARGEQRLQAALEACDAVVITPASASALGDWDSPEDLSAEAREGLPLLRRR